jgi:hypothetical protein
MVTAALGQVFLRVLLLSPVDIIPTMLRIHSHICWMEYGTVIDSSSTEIYILPRRKKMPASNTFKNLVLVNVSTPPPPKRDL